MDSLEGKFGPLDKGLFGVSMKYLRRMHGEDVKKMLDGPYPDGRIERVRRILLESIDEEIAGWVNVEADPVDDNFLDELPDGARSDREIMRDFIGLVLHYMSEESYLEGILNRTLNKMDVNLDVK